jgi:hypothetical protein
MRRIVNEVGQLVWVALEVKELILILVAVDVLEALRDDGAHLEAAVLPAIVLREGVRPARRALIAQDRRQALALRPLQGRLAQQLQHRRRQVGLRGQVSAPARLDPRRPDDEGHPCGPVVHHELLIDVVRAEHLTVVGGDDDHRLLEPSAFLHRLQHDAQAAIHEGGVAQVRRDRDRPSVPSPPLNAQRPRTPANRPRQLGHLGPEARRRLYLRRVKQAHVGLREEQRRMRPAQRAPRGHRLLRRRVDDELGDLPRAHHVRMVLDRPRPGGRHGHADLRVLVAVVGRCEHRRPLGVRLPPLLGQHLPLQLVREPRGDEVRVLAPPIVLLRPVDMPDALVPHLIARILQPVYQQLLALMQCRVGLRRVAQRPVLVRPAAVHHRGPRGHAHGSRAVVPLEDHTRLGHPVPGRRRGRPTVGPEHIRLLLVAQQHQQVPRGCFAHH